MRVYLAAFAAMGFVAEGDVALLLAVTMLFGVMTGAGNVVGPSLKADVIGRRVSHGSVSVVVDFDPKAITYARGQWDTLVVFLDDGRAPPHNNTSERLLRAPAAGCHNHLTSRAAHAPQRRPRR